MSALSLRPLLERGSPLIVPGAADVLSAKLIEAHGFPAVYIGSYATAASRFGLRDTGLLSLDQLVGAVKVPVIADAEGGFHEAPDIGRTVRASRRQASPPFTSRTIPARASTRP